MSHDKIRAAARGRMAETGEPYTVARHAVLDENQSARADRLPPGAGYVLRMSGEIHDWLAGLRGDDESAALRVVRALVRLMREGATLTAPLVASTADSWPWALAVALDRSYQKRLERLTVLRRGEADAAALVSDLEEQVDELEAARTKLEAAHRRALDAGRPQRAAHAAQRLAAVEHHAAEVRQLLPRMTEARDRLGDQNRHLQARVDAFRSRKEVLKARHAAVRGALRAREAMAGLGLADDDGNRRSDATGEKARPAEARIADITAQMERQLGQQARPEGLMELWPGAPWHEDIRILFAVEPPGAALLIAVLEGSEAVEDQYPEAVMASADLLRRVRAGEAPEAAEHAYDDPRSLLQEFYPGAADDTTGQ
jgi:phage shock protein A